MTQSGRRKRHVWTADFRCWHKADMPSHSPDIAFRGQSGHPHLEPRRLLLTHSNAFAW